MESAGAAGAVAVESAGPGEVDCCLEQAAKASALIHRRRRLRFIDITSLYVGVGRRGSFTVPGGTQRTVASGVPAGPQPRPRQEGLLLGGGALLLLSRIFRTALAERALINLAATAPAVSLAHEKRSESML